MPFGSVNMAIGHWSLCSSYSNYRDTTTSGFLRLYFYFLCEVTLWHIDPGTIRERVVKNVEILVGISFLPLLNIDI